MKTSFSFNNVLVLGFFCALYREMETLWNVSEITLRTTIKLSTANQFFFCYFITRWEIWRRDNSCQENNNSLNYCHLARVPFVVPFFMFTGTDSPTLSNEDELHSPLTRSSDQLLFYYRSVYTHSSSTWSLNHTHRI